MAEHFCDLRRPLKIYTMAMVCLALLFSVWALPHSHPAVVAWLIAIFAAAAIVDPVPFPYGGTLHPIGGIIQFGALLWQPQDMLLGVGFGCLLGLMVFQKTEPWKAVTNASGWAIGGMTAATVSHRVLSDTPSVISLLVVTLMTVAVRHITNRIIFSVYRSIRFGYPFLSHVHQSIATVMPEELFCAPLIAILAGAALLLKTTTWSLVLTAAYLVVLPIPNRKCRDHRQNAALANEVVEGVLREVGLLNQAKRFHGDQRAAAERVRVNPSFDKNAIANFALSVGAQVLAVAEMYDKVCAGARANGPTDSREIVERELSATVGVVHDSNIVPTLLSVAYDLGLRPSGRTLSDG